MQPLEIATAVDAEAKTLIERLRSLSDEDWRQPTGLGDWEVRDVVVHLADRAIGFFTETMARGLEGEVSAPPGYDLKPIDDEQKRRQAIATRALSRRADDMQAVVEQLRAVSERFRTLQSGLKPADLDKPCWMSSGTRPVREIGPIILQEMTLHSWDIRSMFDDDVHMARASMPLVVRRVIDVLKDPAAQFHSNEYSAGAGKVTTVHVVFPGSDGEPGDVHLELNGGAMTVSDNPGTAADVSLKCRGEPFALLLYKRISIEDAVGRELLEVEGAENAVLEFEAWLNDVTIRGLH